MATIPHVSTPPDPIDTAIAVHRNAWEAFQIAPAGPAATQTEFAMDAALDALLGTPCRTRFGALALLAHLRWWLAEEAPYAASYQPAYGLAQARAADLTLFLGTNAPPVRIPAATPLGRLSSPSLVSEPLSHWPIPAGLMPARPLEMAGDFLAALVLICGGSVLTALATLA